MVVRIHVGDYVSEPWIVKCRSCQLLFDLGSACQLVAGIVCSNVSDAAVIVLYVVRVHCCHSISSWWSVDRYTPNVYTICGESSLYHCVRILESLKCISPDSGDSEPLIISALHDSGALLVTHETNSVPHLIDDLLIVVGLNESVGDQPSGGSDTLGVLEDVDSVYEHESPVTCDNVRRVSQLSNDIRIINILEPDDGLCPHLP